ncbi:hypothetical protein Bca52824_092679 [Brassica carinata]|uniref:Uncharacterized protein n=1 Tax=Brassica carinata TaxID=52824 RepID=A0A8X7NRX3_BRACI|nr:hypothetical protein Bca52824_092679 [Brassica carinata]
MSIPQAKMELRPLGNTGLKVSSVGFGASPSEASSVQSPKSMQSPPYARRSDKALTSSTLPRNNHLFYLSSSEELTDS